MTLPVAPVERPLDLIGADNGNLDASLLVTVGPAGTLHHLAARSWRALHAAAYTAGFSLTYSYGGTYRTYSQQVQLFKQRYTLTYLAGRPTKVWQGQTWYQLPNTAMAAVPGTSNHGFGLAIDTAIGPDPAHSTSLTSTVINWMVAHVATYGFSYEVQSEPWHIRLVTGDRIPAAVLAYENQQKPQPQPIPQPTPVEDEDMTLYRKQGKSAVWLADGRSRKHVTTQAQADALRAIYGPILLLDEAQSLGDLGIVVGVDPGDV